MRNGLWKLVSGKLPRPRDEDELAKWETKAEKAAGEIYLLMENDQRVHFRGHKNDPIQMWQLLEAAHLSKKLGAHFNAYDIIICSPYESRTQNHWWILESELKSQCRPYKICIQSTSKLSSWMKSFSA